MRCDYPMGYDEDYLEPACEIFLQLFLQNAQIAANEETQDNEGAVNADFGGYESDDSFSFPSLHTISDESLSCVESSGDEGESLIIGSINQESNYHEIFAEDSLDVLLESHSSVQSYNSEDDAEEVHDVNDENTDVLSDHHQVAENSLNSENSDDLTNVAFQESNDCVGSASNDLFPANETVCFEESSAQTDITANNINPSPVNTYVSLYVVVPPTSFSDNLLSEVSSDRLNSDATPVNSPSTSSFVSDNGNTPIEDESLHTITKIYDNLEGLASDSSAVSSSLSITENDKDHILELNSASDIKDSISSESTDSFDENSHPRLIAFNAHLSEEMNTQQYSNTNCDATSDKSVPSLKRKVVGSVDVDILNKVPKYSLSHESNESVNEASLDNYCKELSSDNELSKLCDEDKIDTLPTTISAENAILPLGNTEENSVTEQQTDL